jgi:hypothetical protein
MPATDFSEEVILDVADATGRNGRSISRRVCIVIKLGVNALISRIDEYFDQAELAPLMS